MPGLTWPPRDTDRNRILCRAQLVLYALITVYFLVFALATGALVPWTIFTLALAATLVVVIALALMRAQRFAHPAAPDHRATPDAGAPAPGPDPASDRPAPGGSPATPRGSTATPGR